MSDGARDAVIEAASRLCELLDQPYLQRDLASWSAEYETWYQRLLAAAAGAQTRELAEANGAGELMCAEVNRLRSELADVRKALDECDLRPHGSLADRIRALTHHHREWKSMFADLSNRVQQEREKRTAKLRERALPKR